MTDLGFIHRFLPGASEDSPVLLTLHGTDANEDDPIPLGQKLLPGAAILSPRGKMLEKGMPRFFRRLAEDIPDENDLKLQTHQLAKFITAAREHYGFHGNKLAAVGYSDGASIASSLMLLHPHSLSAAVLFRAMVPFQLHPPPDLTRTYIFLSAGRKDPIIPSACTLTLQQIFQNAGAHVTVEWHAGGHELGDEDVEAARLWLGHQNLNISSDNLPAQPD